MLAIASRASPTLFLVQPANRAMAEAPFNVEPTTLCTFSKPCYNVLKRLTLRILTSTLLVPSNRGSNLGLLKEPKSLVMFSFRSTVSMGRSCIVT